MTCTVPFLGQLTCQLHIHSARFFHLVFFSRDAFVSGVGIDISPPRPLLFFCQIHGPSEFVLYRLNRSVSTFANSFCICDIIFFYQLQPINK